MRICLLSRHFNLRGAGLGRVAQEIQKGLIKRGHSICLISTNGTSLYSYFYYTLIGIRGMIPKGGIEVYHALTPMEAMWLPKGKSVVTFHDLFQLTNPDRLGSGLGHSRWKNIIGANYFKLAVTTAVQCKGIVAVSEATKGGLVEYLGTPKDKVQVIKSGINNNLDPQPKKNKVFRIGYLGQLDRRKRVNLLIDAFRRSNLDELVIGGIGIDEAILKAQATGDKRIKFLGLVPDRELVDFYNSLDVFVFPTWLEGYGLPIVEAMACKKPVIVLRDAEIPWEVKDRCVVVDSLNWVLKDAEYLKEELCGGVDIEGNYKWAKSHSWDTCVDSYIRLYEEIVGGQH